MARKDILPTYLSNEVWRDLCDAIDAVFGPAIDTPTNNLGKLRRPWLLKDSAQEKIENGELLTPADLDVFETEYLVKQVNMSGLIMANQDKFGNDVKARFFRHLPRFWYSKGTISVADFLGYVLNTTITMTRLWTNDYVTFLPEGDPGIGTPIYSGGTWYPTTHTQVELDASVISGEVSLEVFARLFESLCNYPLVPQYILTVEALWVSTTSGRYVYLEFVGETVEQETIATFTLAGGDLTAGYGEGGFETIDTVALPGPGGTGYTPPAVPVPDFSASVTSGAAPLSVTFTNLTTGYVISQDWDFELDGVVDSHDRDPATVVYSTPGVYSVKLSAFNESGVASELKTDYITVT